MKTCLSLLSSALLLAMSSSAFAASSVDLTVKGLITPSACTPAFDSSGGIIDHGKIAAKDLNQTQPTALPLVNVQLTVTCEASTSFAIRPIDNRAGTAVGSSNFGLGLINGDKKLGQFYITPTSLIADGAQAQPIASYDGGTSWAAERYWELNSLWAAGAMGDATSPIQAKVLQLALQVGTAILQANNFDFSNEEPIDGSATLEVVYL